MQQLRNDYSLTFPPLSIARYSFIQLSRLKRREVKENAQTSKRYQRGFEPGLSRLRVRHSTTEPPRTGVGQQVHNEGTGKETGGRRNVNATMNVQSYEAGQDFSLTLERFL